MFITSPLSLSLDDRLLLQLPALQVAPGQVLTLMGPSGCGKSSLLAALAGVLPPGGPIRLTGELWLGERRLTGLPPQQRRIGILFQDDLLFSHLTVAENLMFAMPARNQGLALRRERALDALAQIALAPLATRLPDQLSGGQRARISLLRALLAEPEALLLDEPFSRLDKPLRAAFRRQVFQQIGALAIPAILVSHDMDDAPGTVLTLSSPKESDLV